MNKYLKEKQKAAGLSKTNGDSEPENRQKLNKVKKKKYMEMFAEDYKEFCESLMEENLAYDNNSIKRKLST